MPELRELVAEELAAPVDPRVRSFAEAIAKKHGAASRAVLFYGSCLREKQLDGLMLDFYLIVSDYRAAYEKGWLATANRMVPPNVFYFEHDGLVGKYAVLSEADSERECGPKARSTSVIARFAQPSRLAWFEDARAKVGVVASISGCAPTLLAFTAALDPAASVLELWKRAFALTFAAELRAERGDRSAQIVEADPKRYRRFGEAALKATKTVPDEPTALAWWKRMQRKGKLLSVVRLAKASFTFAGGADYIVWKVNRHAGTSIELKPWQRRWPLLAGLTLLPRLLKSGAVR
jgi:hypothetical protein